MNLKTYRQQKGLTLEQVGAAIGANKSTVQRIENAKTMPKRSMARRIVDWSGGAVTLADLYGDQQTDLPLSAESTPQHGAAA